MKKLQDNTLDITKLTKTDRRFLKEYSTRPDVAKWWNYRVNAGKGTEAAYSAVMALFVLPCFNVVVADSIYTITYKRRGNLVYSYCEGEQIGDPIDIGAYFNTSRDRTDYLTETILVNLIDNMGMITGIEFVPKALSPEGRKLVKATMLTQLFCAYAHIETEDQFDAALYPILLYGIDYRDKLISCTKTIVPDGNIEAQMREIKEYYKDFIGKKPQNFTTGE